MRHSPEPGCIIAKMIIHCADVMRTVQIVAAFGIHAKVERIGWPFFVHLASEEVDAKAANLMRVQGGVDAITQSIYVHPALPEVLQRAVGQLPV